MKRAYLYTLSEDSCGPPRYVGCTVNPKLRRSSHRSRKVNPTLAVDRWTDSLARSGRRPEMEIVACVVGNAFYAEKELHDQLVRSGCDLLNAPYKDFRWRDRSCPHCGQPMPVT